jgi:hypothetical protein
MESGSTRAPAEEKSTMAAEFTFPTHIVAVEESITEAVRSILSIARATLVEQGTHLPTAILHTLEGMFPIILPFKDDEQKRSLVAYVKGQALERHAYAVTTVTCAQVVDSRTGEHDEVLVVATAIQGGRPYVVVQHFSRDSDRIVRDFGEMVEGEDAAMPGQMLIFPDWDEEVKH